MNYNKFANQLKEFFVDFGLKVSRKLHKPEIKFINDMIFGIASSKSIHLSNIARSLKETISIKEIVDRLSYNLDKLNNEIVWKNYRNDIRNQIDKDTLFNLDDSDVIKPYGKHFESLCEVKDGSSKDNKIEKGYPVTEIVAVTKNNSHPISVYSNIYSTIKSGFKSANIQTDNALDIIYSSFGNIGTVVMDRGYDDNKRMNYFLEKNWNFIIRGKGNRKVTYQGREYNVLEFADKYKGKINIKVHLKRKTVNRKSSYFKVKLRGVKKPIYLVIVYFKGDPAIFYTNRNLTCKKDVVKVVSDYFKRWRIEEYFKFKKTEFGFENFRVRSLKRINSLNTLLSMTINAIAFQCEKKSQLSYAILENAKAIKEIVYFNYYRIANGIYILLSNLKTGIKDLFSPKNKEKQLQLFSIFDTLENFPET